MVVCKEFTGFRPGGIGVGVFVCMVPHGGAHPPPTTTARSRAATADERHQRKATPPQRTSSLSDFFSLLLSSILLLCIQPEGGSGGGARGQRPRGATGAPPEKRSAHYRPHGLRASALPARRKNGAAAAGSTPKSWFLGFSFWCSLPGSRTAQRRKERRGATDAEC